jgi:Domain of unknown function (DUF4406)
MKVYLFGPMRGYENFNFPAFAAAEAQLCERGHEVFSPAARDLAEGFDPAGRGTDGELAEKRFSLREALRADLDWICRHAEALAGLPGWRDSAGSRAEVHAAWALGIPVHELEDFLEDGPAAVVIARHYPLISTIRRKPGDPVRS